MDIYALQNIEYVHDLLRSEYYVPRKQGQTRHSTIAPLST